MQSSVDESSWHCEKACKLNAIMKHINKLSFKNYNARAYHGVGYLFSWAKAPALYVTMSQVVVEEEEEKDHFLEPK